METPGPVKIVRSVMNRICKLAILLAKKLPIMTRARAKNVIHLKTK